MAGQGSAGRYRVLCIVCRAFLPWQWPPIIVLEGPCRGSDGQAGKEGRLGGQGRRAGYMGRIGGQGRRAG